MKNLWHLVGNLKRMGGGIVRDAVPVPGKRPVVILILGAEEARELIKLLEGAWCICGNASNGEGATVACPRCPPGRSPARQRKRVWKRARR